jgi:DNA-binding HxlR family transcriptional regulator
MVKLVTMEKLETPQEEICFCPLHGLLDVIAKKWSLLVVAILGNEGEKGFNQLKNELEGISPKTLSGTLKKLEKLRLVSKRILATSPPNVRYSLTEDGWKLREYLIPILTWASRNGAKKAPWCHVKYRETEIPGQARPSQDAQ